MNRFEHLEVVGQGSDFIEVRVHVSCWQDAGGAWIVERDFKVGGEIWRVHKNDADPFPSQPHAHCVDGAERFLGCTLHLGTRGLYRKREFLDRYLHERQFGRLIELIRPKFPGINLPLHV